MLFNACDKDTSVNVDDHAIYKPLELDDWSVSTPEEQGLNPNLVLDAYQDAEKLRNIYSLLIIKNGHLVAEKYFNGQRVSKANPIASVTKSYTSALIGVALRESILSSLDQKMMEFFPEFDWQNLDPRKAQITIRQILKMRSGYPWEEFSPYLDVLFSRGNWIPFIAEFPLSSDPGYQFGYSNLTAHMMGIILARAASTSLLSFAQTFLFDPLEVNVAHWPSDSLGYYYGSGGTYLTPRDLAKFGSLYLNGGLHNGVQIIPSDWVTESLQPYSFNIYNDPLIYIMTGLAPTYAK
jgi:CubicO group peptidase (beta-lactamase class C family)